MPDVHNNGNYLAYFVTYLEIVFYLRLIFSCCNLAKKSIVQFLADFCTWIKQICEFHDIYNQTSPSLCKSGGQRKSGVMMSKEFCSEIGSSSPRFVVFFSFFSFLLLLLLIFPSLSFDKCRFWILIPWSSSHNHHIHRNMFVSESPLLVSIVLGVNLISYITKTKQKNFHTHCLWTR